MQAKKLVINGFFSVILMASGSVLAERPNFGSQTGQNSERPTRAGGQHGFMQEGPAFDRARMALKLQLTEEQREEINAIHEAARELKEPVVEELVINRQAIKELIKVDPYEAAAVGVLATAQGELYSQLVLIRANAKAAVYGLLTDEQKAILDEGRPDHFAEAEEE